MINFSPPLVQLDINRHCVAYDDVQGNGGNGFKWSGPIYLAAVSVNGIGVALSGEWGLFYPNHSDAPQEKIGGAGDFSPSLDY